MGILSKIAASDSRFSPDPFTGLMPYEGKTSAEREAEIGRLSTTGEEAMQAEVERYLAQGMSRAEARRKAGFAPDAEDINVISIDNEEDDGEAGSSPPATPRM